MKESDSHAHSLRRSVWIGAAIAFVAIVIAVVASWLLYGRTTTLLTENLRERLLTISITQAANIDASDLEALQTENDWRKPEWAEVVNRLHRAKYENEDIVYMYIFRKTKDDPRQMEFVADADSIDPYANSSGDSSKYVDVNGDGIVEPEGSDKLQWPGQSYPEAVDIPEAFEAYNGPLTAADLYTDSYGTVLTGYAPIKDDQGNVVAILAADIKANDFLTITRQTLYPFILFIGFLTVVISILVGILVYLWGREAKTREHVEQLARDLTENNIRQEGLIRFISHEVKGYLTKNQAVFAAMTEGDFGVLSDAMKPFVSEALTQTREGVESVMDILKASNQKKGMVDYKKEPFDVAALVTEILTKHKSTAEKKGLTLSLVIADAGKPYTLVGDKTEMGEHALRNLFENALTYTLNGSIEVSLKKEKGKIMFAIKDTGIGIADEDKPRLFTEGGHGKDSQRINVHSTGYGLYIAKNVVAAHGGTIAASSEGPGKGSTFTVEFPV